MFPSALVLLLFSVSPAFGVAWYWDTNGAVAGSGNAGGVWDADPFWSDFGFDEPVKEAAARAGNQETQGWGDGRDVYFSSGSDGAGPFTVTIQKRVVVRNFILEEGQITVRGGILNLEMEGTRPAYFALDPGTSLVIDSLILRSDIREAQPDSIALYKVGPGSLSLKQPVFMLVTNLAPPQTVVEGGVLKLEGNHLLPTNSPVILRNGGRRGFLNTPATFHTGGFSHTLGPLSLQGPVVTLDFGDGASALSFADSDMADWGTHRLMIRNFTPGSDSLRIGTDADGFEEKLSRIRFVDFPIPGNVVPAVMDASGYITPDPNAPTISQHPQSITVPAGEKATFAVTATGTGPLSYQWHHNNVPILGATGPTFQIEEVEYVEAGEYFVAVSRGGSVTESARATLRVTVPQAPAPRIQSLEIRDGRVILSWESVKARRYMVEYHVDLAAESDWEFLGNAQATGPLTTREFPLESHHPVAPAHYYRVLLLPEFIP